MLLPENGCWDPLLPLVWLLGFRVLVPVVGPTSVTFGFSEATLCTTDLDRVSCVCHTEQQCRHFRVAFYALHVYLAGFIISLPRHCQQERTWSPTLREGDLG